MRLANWLTLIVSCALLFCASHTRAALVAHWSFDGNLLDSSGNGNHLSLATGSVTYGSAAPTLGSTSSFSFNGATMLNNVAPVNFGFTGPYTFAAWINAPLPGSNYHGWFWRGVPGGGDIEIYGQATTNLLYTVNNRTNAGTMDYMGFAVAPASTYYHLAVMFNGTNWTTYYNGVAAGVADVGPAGTSPLIATAAHQISVGKLNHLQFNPNFAIGLMDEAFVFNQTLTPLQLANLMDFNNINGPPVPEPSTFAILGLGAIGLAIRTRRRRTAA